MFLKLALINSLIFFSLSVQALNPGNDAIDFSLQNQNGETVKLSDFKGKIIILEWFNHGCPYVKKHYNSGNMQATQRIYQENTEVVWLSIISSAKGKQGFMATPKDAKNKMKEVAMASDFLLLDHTGEVGQKYSAKTTPHIYIIGADFKLKYQGAIDSIPSASEADISKATNYITSSVSKIMLKQVPNPSKTKAYGCSVKY